MNFFNLSSKLIAIIAIVILQISTPSVTAEDQKVTSHGSGVIDTPHAATDAYVDEFATDEIKPHNTKANSIGSLRFTRYLDETDDEDEDAPDSIVGQMFVVILILLLSPIAIVLWSLSQIMPGFEGLYATMQESICESIEFWDLDMNPFGICSEKLY